MSVDIRDSKLLDAAPPSISADVNVQAVFEALDRQFRDLIDDINQTIIKPAIDQITRNDLLDALAWEFHVDFYDASAPVAVKQLLVKASLDWHTRKGTVQLIQDVCDEFFPPGSATVQEWFEYKIPFPPNYPEEDPDANGYNWHDRYRFRILVDQEVVDPAAEQIVARIVRAYKPLTRWDEGIIRARRSDLDIFWGAASLTWKYVTVEAPEVGVPIINTLDPPQAFPGSEVTLEVEGANFFFNSVIYFDGNQIPTTYVDSEHLVSANAFNVGPEGNKPVYVRTNMTDSNIVFFTVTTAIDPILSTLIPPQALVGDIIPDFAVGGWNFENDMEIWFDNVRLDTTFISSSRLEADDPLDVGGLGFKPVQVRGPVKQTNIVFFGVTADPSITLLRPDTAPIDVVLPSLQVIGQNFVDPSRIMWDGAAIPTTFVSSTELVSLNLDVGNSDRSVEVQVVDDRILARMARAAKAQLKNETGNKTKS